MSISAHLTRLYIEYAIDATVTKKFSDTGNRTPSCRDQSRNMRGGNVSRYTISEFMIAVAQIPCCHYVAISIC